MVRIKSYLLWPLQSDEPHLFNTAYIAGVSEEELTDAEMDFRSAVTDTPVTIGVSSINPWRIF